METARASNLRRKKKSGTQPGVAPRGRRDGHCFRAVAPPVTQSRRAFQREPRQPPEIPARRDSHAASSGFRRRFQAPPGPQVPQATDQSCSPLTPQGSLVGLHQSGTVCRGPAPGSLGGSATLPGPLLPWLQFGIFCTRSTEKGVGVHAYGRPAVPKPGCALPGPVKLFKNLMPKPHLGTITLATQGTELRQQPCLAVLRSQCAAQLRNGGLSPSSGTQKPGRLVGKQTLTHRVRLRPGSVHFQQARRGLCDGWSPDRRARSVGASLPVQPLSELGLPGLDNMGCPPPARPAGSSHPLQHLRGPHCAGASRAPAPRGRGDGDRHAGQGTEAHLGQHSPRGWRDRASPPGGLRRHRRPDSQLWRPALQNQRSQGWLLPGAGREGSSRASLCGVRLCGVWSAQRVDGRLLPACLPVTPACVSTFPSFKNVSHWGAGSTVTTSCRTSAQESATQCKP